METAEDAEQRQFLCSACLQMVPESRIHVIPHYNDVARGYVTTYRCEECRLPSLQETRARLEATHDESEIASAAEFFKRYGVFVHEYLRGDPAPIVRTILLHVIGLLRSGDLRLPIGALAPERKADEPGVEIKRNEELAEAAYDAMYDAKPYLVKDCFDDAHGYLSEAIDIAKRAGLNEEAARLTARRDHITSVYNSQFRGIR